MQLTNISINSNTFLLINGVDYRSSLKEGEGINITFDSQIHPQISRGYGGRNIITVNQKENRIDTVTVPLIAGTEGYIALKNIIEDVPPNNIFSFELKTPYIDIKSSIAIGKDSSIGYQPSATDVLSETIEIQLSNATIEYKEIGKIGE